MTECTVRPLKRAGEAKLPFDGIRVAEFRAAGGRRMFGIITPSAFDASVWGMSPTLFLGSPVGSIVAHPLLDQYNSVIMANSPRVSLALGWAAHMSDEEARALMGLAYQALGMGPSELFPLECRAVEPVEGVVGPWRIDGFLRPVGNGVVEAWR